MEGHRLFPPLNVFILKATKFEGAPRPSEEKKTRTNKHPTLWHSKRLVSSLVFFCEAISMTLWPQTAPPYFQRAMDAKVGIPGLNQPTRGELQPPVAPWHSNKSPSFRCPSDKPPLNRKETGISPCYQTVITGKTWFTSLQHHSCWSIDNKNSDTDPLYPSISYKPASILLINL